jgi:hypothetical protein
MAEVLSEKIEVPKENRVIVGQQMLEIITSGMYDNPLMIYREYIQNAVDSIDSAVCQGLLEIEDGQISIDIDGRTRTVTVEDNGCGVSNSKVIDVLGSLGLSPKAGCHQRGFRGIGRLGGLSYCDLLKFETRSSEGEHVAVIEWDNKQFEAILNLPNCKKDIVEAIDSILTIKFREPSPADPPHYFRVELSNVRPFHDNLIMSPAEVGKYISTVAPVPYNRQEFSFSNELDEYLSVLPGYRSYNIFLNGRSIHKAFSDRIQLSEGSLDTIEGIDTFEWSDGNGKSIARGWFARTSLLGSLPSNVLFRGIRVRQGNIEVGDEHFLAGYYTERRFATWHIGEIHVYDHCIKQNARRDGFEQSPELERFLEYAYYMGRSLSSLCRKASTKRNKDQRLSRVLNDLEALTSKRDVFIDEDHFEQQQEIQQVRTEEAKQLIHQLDKENTYSPRLELIHEQIEVNYQSPLFLRDMLDGRSLRHKNPKDLLEEVSKTIAECYDSTNSASDLIERITMPYLRTSIKKTNK